MPSVVVSKTPSGRLFVEFAVPVTPEILETTFGRNVVEEHRTEDGQVRLPATLAKHFLGILRDHESYLTPGDRQTRLELRALADEWAKQERRVWRALAFHQARTSRTQPAPVVEDRSAPRARECKPSGATRRVRTAATSGDPPLPGSDDDDPHDLDALAARAAA